LRLHWPRSVPQSRDKGPSRRVLGPPVVSVQEVRFLPAALRARRDEPSSRDCPRPSENKECRVAALLVTRGFSNPARLPSRGDDCRLLRSYIYAHRGVHLVGS